MNPRKRTEISMKRWLGLGLLVFCGDNQPSYPSFGATEPSRIVYVAVKRVPQLTKLREPADYFVAKAIPAHDVPADAITNLEALRDRGLKEALAEGCIIRSRDLASKEYWSFEPPPSLRAFDLSFTDCILPETGVITGVRVDVIFTRYAGCEVEISNILVLEIAPVQPGEKPTDPVKPPHVRLAMTPAEAQQVAMGIASGKVIVREHRRK
jgi:Flp pilus assembly protein CpaB